LWSLTALGDHLGMSEIILMSDPRVAAIPVHECGERLVDVRRGPLLVDLRKQDDSDVFFPAGRLAGASAPGTGALAGRPGVPGGRGLSSSGVAAALL
jgi:hypothetical protein